MNKNILWALGLGFACSTETFALQAKEEPIQPIEPMVVTQPQKVELGQKLFFDPRLSQSGFMSCNSCHNLSMGGSDNLQTSIGHNWQKSPINSPTVLNASMNIAQFWDGRAADLKTQASDSVNDSSEKSGSNHIITVKTLQSIPEYRDAFLRIYGVERIGLYEVTDAIAEFEKTLITPNARFDKWLKGDENVLTQQEKDGYQLFKDNGCIACHNGVSVGGNSFQKMGMMVPYKTENPAIGLAGVTQKDADRMKFKVPTLRNIELTYPYFHDGAYWKLEEAVDVMARVQLGRKLTEHEIEKITAFLKTLTGEQPKITLPVLPPSTNETPHPQPFN